jgi:phosphatidylcholine synthase
MQQTTVPNRIANLSALFVHFYTGLGTVLAFLMVILVIEGDLVLALWVGLATMAIDGTDGMLARHFQVKERIPWFDGELLDNIVDYITYTFVPVVMLWRGGYLPEGWPGMAIAAVTLMSSAYQFCRVDAKTDDHFFLGFPSYWNVIAFYAIVMSMSPTTVGIILVICSILVFVPIYYVYPSRSLQFRTSSLLVSGLWLLSYAALLLLMPTPPQWLLIGSLLCIVYYVGVSLYLTYVRANKLRAQRSASD